MGRYSIIFRTPKTLKFTDTRFFLTEVERIFSLPEKETENVLFETLHTQEIDLLGALLIYKFVEYTVTHKCFRNPQTTLLTNSSRVYEQLDDYGFLKLISSFFKDEEKKRILEQNKEYDNLKFIKNDRFVLAPIVLNQGSSDIVLSRQLHSYYSYDNNIAFVVLQCIGEIAQNFAEHAVDDTRSIIAACGNKSRLEIACADTGKGIISSLKQSLESNLEPYEVLDAALRRDVTSKKNSSHMGYGLWMVNELVNAVKGQLCIFSEGAYVNNMAGKNKHGLCSYWKGTIVYLNIPLNKTEGYSMLRKKWLEDYNDIKLSTI